MCVTDGHCSAPLDVDDDSSVALCHNGCVMSDPGNDFGSVFDAVSGAKLSNRRYDCLRVDTSSALLWRGEAQAVVASSGPNSAGRVVAHVDRHDFTSFRYGVALNKSEVRVLRFDVDPESTAEPDRKASVAVCSPL